MSSLIKTVTLCLVMVTIAALTACKSDATNEVNNETTTKDTLLQLESELDNLAPVGIRPDCILIDCKYTFVNRYGEISEKRYDDVDIMEEAIFAIRNDTIFRIDSLGNEIIDPYQNKCH